MRSALKNYGVIIFTVILSSVCTLLISNAVAFVFAQDSQEIKPLAIYTPPKWQYKVGSVRDSSLQTTLDDMGRNGWDIAFARRAVTGDEHNRRGIYEFIFKRPIQD